MKEQTMIPDWVPKEAWEGFVEKQRKLKQFLHYDQETGIFTRLQDTLRSKKGQLLTATNKSGHMSVKFDGSTQLLHRLAWLYVYGWEPRQIDHINGIKTDNRICNLREASNSENQQNLFAARRGNSSGYLGVSRRKYGRWLAQIVVNGVNRYLGVFDDPKEAHEVYMKAKSELHPFASIVRNKNGNS